MRAAKGDFWEVGATGDDRFGVTKPVDLDILEFLPMTKKLRRPLALLDWAEMDFECSGEAWSDLPLSKRWPGHLLHGIEGHD